MEDPTAAHADLRHELRRNRRQLRELAKETAELRLKAQQAQLNGKPIIVDETLGGEFIFVDRDELLRRIGHPGGA